MAKRSKKMDIVDSALTVAFLKKLVFLDSKGNYHLTNKGKEWSNRRAKR